MSSKRSLDLNVKDLCKEYAEQATTHGLRRIAETKTSFGRVFWSFVFLSALAGCFYHSSFLIQKYLNFSKVTTTEEIHAKQLQFPALTVCNMNILKNSFFTEQLAKNENTTHERKKGMYKSFVQRFSFLPFKKNSLMNFEKRLQFINSHSVHSSTLSFLRKIFKSK